MKILVVEPIGRGHRGAYASRLLQGLHAAGHQMVFATSSIGLEHDSLRWLGDDENKDIETVVCDPIPNDLIEGKVSPVAQLRAWLYFRRMAIELGTRHTDIDCVFVCYLDAILQSSAIFGSPFKGMRLAGIVMKVKFHFKAMGISPKNFGFSSLKEFLFNRLLKNRNVHRIYTIDESLTEYMGKKGITKRKLGYLADPADFECQSSRAMEGVSKIEQPVMVNSVPSILVYGWLNRRKGLQHLFRALDVLAIRGISVRLVLAGQQDEFVKKLVSDWMSSSSTSIHSIKIMDKYVSSAEEYDLFDQATIVWLAYESFFVMSGVMVQAGQMGKPIIASDQGLIAWKTRRHETGVLVNPADGDVVAGAVMKLTQDEQLYARLALNARNLYSEHTTSAFIERIAADFDR